MIVPLIIRGVNLHTTVSNKLILKKDSCHTKEQEGNISMASHVYRTTQLNNIKVIEAGHTLQLI